MFRELHEAEFQPFFQLRAEPEVGRHFDPANRGHGRWLSDRITRNFARGVRFFAAYEDDASPRGLVSLYVDDLIAWKLGFITHLGVFSEFRGSGYGSKLLAYAAEQAQLEGCYCLYLDTYAGNPRNVEFYAKNGFIPVATIPDMNGPGDEGQVWFRKILADKPQHTAQCTECRSIADMEGAIPGLSLDNIREEEDRS